MGKKKRKKSKKKLSLSNPWTVVLIIVIIAIIIYVLSLLSQAVLLNSTYNKYTDVHKELTIGIAPYTEWIDKIKADEWAIGKKYEGSPLNPWGDIATLLTLRSHYESMRPKAT